MDDEVPNEPLELIPHGGGNVVTPDEVVSRSVQGVYEAMGGVWPYGEAFTDPRTGKRYILNVDVQIVEATDEDWANATDDGEDGEDEEDEEE